MIEIYLDENLSPNVADALNSLDKGYFQNVTVSSTKTQLAKGFLMKQLFLLLANLAEF